jgi:FtsP/CotA-like multicopper oxidase with cupredoxin domain
MTRMPPTPVSPTRVPPTRCLSFFVLLAVLALPAAAQIAPGAGAPDVCPYQTFGQELQNPREVRPDAQNVLRLDFVARVVEAGCVPAFGLATCACTPGNCPAGCACPSPSPYVAATNTCGCPTGTTPDGAGNCNCPSGQIPNPDWPPADPNCSSCNAAVCIAGSGSASFAPPGVSCLQGQQWSMNRMPLRMWGTSIDPLKKVDPDDPQDPNTVYTFPGPTMRVRKSDAGTHNGTRLKLNLYNRLPYQNYPSDPDACKPACVIEPPQPIGKADPVKYPQGQLVCMDHPDCFHGPNVTNLHFHGTHISPQEHSDFVLLALFPKGADRPGPHMHDHGVNQIGDYWYDIDPIPDNQAEGTHWYHPHKHGSTAEQVLNGMSGALLIEGPFDDWLYALYGVDPKDPAQLARFEKVLVLQQIWPNVNFYNPGDHLKVYPPGIVVNGQAAPVIKMQAGEIQRWRFINATMQAGAQIQLQPPPGVVWKQIAQDGVRFAEANYIAQPIYGSDSSAPLNSANFPFSPGQRADFLVQAPAEPGTYLMTHQVLGKVHERIRKTLDARHLQLKKVDGKLLNTTERGEVTAAGAVLFTIVVEGEAKPMRLPSTSADKGAGCGKSPKSADCWPEMPDFLKDLDPAKAARERTIAFSMEGTAPGQQPNTFTINGDGYDPNCASETMRLGDVEQWTVTNDSPLQHPFHIHINPFQLTEYGGAQLAPPWIWFDTVPVALPQTSATPGAPKQPACSAGNACFKMVTQFEDYTGEYVLHCHFLGHEDRGMMENVQVVCPADGERRDVFGRRATYRPECQDGDHLPASPRCADVAGGASKGHSGHGEHGGHAGQGAGTGQGAGKARSPGQGSGGN